MSSTQFATLNKSYQDFNWPCTLTIHLDGLWVCTVKNPSLESSGTRYNFFQYSFVQYNTFLCIFLYFWCSFFSQFLIFLDFIFFLGWLEGKLGLILVQEGGVSVSTWMTFLSYSVFILLVLDKSCLFSTYFSRCAFKLGTRICVRTDVFVSFLKARSSS